jgi:hypothetical protein
MWQIKAWWPPLFAFMDIFGPPHLVVLGLIALHVAF